MRNDARQCSLPDRTEHARTMDWIVQAFRQFALLAVEIEDHDVVRAREAVQQAESFGFVLDPTAYRKALTTGSLRRQQQLLELFARTKAELTELFPDLKLWDGPRAVPPPAHRDANDGKEVNEMVEENVADEPQPEAPAPATTEAQGEADGGDDEGDEEGEE
jgi:hypothetical protein